MHILPILRKK